VISSPTLASRALGAESARSECGISSMIKVAYGSLYSDLDTLLVRAVFLSGALARITPSSRLVAWRICVPPSATPPLAWAR